MISSQVLGSDSEGLKVKESMPANLAIKCLESMPMRWNLAMKPLENENAKGLDDAFNISAGAKMKLVVGKERQIPGLVPVQAEIGDLIALKSNSNVPIILPPTPDPPRFRWSWISANHDTDHNTV